MKTNDSTISLGPYSQRQAKWFSNVPPKKVAASQSMIYGYDPCVEKYTVGTLTNIFKLELTLLC